MSAAANAKVSPSLGSAADGELRRSGAVDGECCPSLPVQCLSHKKACSGGHPPLPWPLMSLGDCVAGPSQQGRSHRGPLPLLSLRVGI